MVLRGTLFYQSKSTGIQENILDQNFDIFWKEEAAVMPEIFEMPARLAKSCERYMWKSLVTIT